MLNKRKSDVYFANHPLTLVIYQPQLGNYLIEKVDEKSYERILNSAFSRYDSFHSRIKSSLLRWDRSTTKKSVWTNDSLYKSVIMKGCYPLHPITVWLLANMNNWMQQRSAITFVAEMVDRISNADVEGTWLPYVYPINIIDSSIYNEMLNSEEKGLVQSQYCMLYRDIKVKIGDKLTKRTNNKWLIPRYPIERNITLNQFINKVN